MKDVRFVIILVVVAIIYFASKKVIEKLFPDASYATVRNATKLVTMLLGAGVSFLILTVFNL